MPPRTCRTIASLSVPIAKMQVAIGSNSRPQQPARMKPIMERSGKIVHAHIYKQAMSGIKQIFDDPVQPQEMPPSWLRGPVWG